MTDPVTILAGDCRQTLTSLPDRSVHTCITSPPYWKLRSYLPEGHPDKGKEIGSEPTAALFIETLVSLFREVRRVLRDDGTLWVNMGDSYSHSGSGTRDETRWPKQSRNDHMPVHAKKTSGFKPKDLCLIPHRLAIALQEDGWWVRQDCVWSKSTAMPESVADRPARAHEYVFLFSKSEHYYYDADAVRTALSPKTRTTYTSKRRAREDDATGLVASIRMDKTMPDRKPRLDPDGNEAGANLRSVWTFASKPYDGAHFATFPPQLPETCIRAATSAKGCCPACGAPWERLTEERRVEDRPGDAHGRDGRAGNRYVVEVDTIGWEPSCTCSAGDPVPCVVLDVFGGTFTTVAVALTLGRHAIACELVAESIALGRERLGLFAPKVAR